MLFIFAFTILPSSLSCFVIDMRFCIGAHLDKICFYIYHVGAKMAEEAKDSAIKAGVDKITKAD